MSLLAIDAARAGDTDCGSVPLPPHRFDHAPALTVTVVQVPFGAVDTTCRAHGVTAPRAFLEARPGAMGLLNEVTQEGFETQACSWRSGEQGFVLLPIVGEGGVTPAWQACALRHEIAHLNGWPASHPDGYFGNLPVDVATWTPPPPRPIVLVNMRHPYRRIPTTVFEASGASLPHAP